MNRQLKFGYITARFIRLTYFIYAMRTIISITSAVIGVG